MDYVSISSSPSHTLLLKRDGTVYGFGSNTHGQLGPDEFGSERTSFRQIESLENIIYIAATSNISFFIHADGSLWILGVINKRFGFNVDMASSPLKIPNISNVIAVSASMTHILVLRSDGSVLGAGSNMYFQLGLPRPLKKSDEFISLSITNVKQVVAATHFSLFLKEERTVEVAGLNGHNNILNIGKETYADGSIQKMPGVENVIKISASPNHVLLLKADGTVSGFGGNANMQLSSISRWNPHDIIPSIRDIVDVYAGYWFSVFLRADGSFISRGRNGQLRVPSFVEPVMTVSSDSSHLYALTYDGELLSESFVP